MKPVLAVFIRVANPPVSVPRLWPPNPQRLPAKVIRIPPPSRSSRWN
jgi:hypothetical protein